MTNATYTAKDFATKGTGYICKSCFGPAPVGIGYVDHERKINRRAAASRKSCPCGCSTKLA